MSEELQQRTESLRRMVETRDLIIKDLEREIRELKAMLHGFTERDKANEFAKNRVDHKERPICDCVVSESKMARMPEPEGSEPVALLAEEKHGYLYFEIGHAI